MTFTKYLTPLLAPLLVGSIAVGAVACGSDDDGSADDPTEVVWDDARLDAARQEAQGLLGMNEDDLPDDVRIGRRGDEQFALTMDLVPGRQTVELDDDGSGFRVVTVFLETPDGSEQFDIQGG